MGKEKYGVDQTQTAELVKLGASEEDAREIVASGKAEGKIKEARARQAGTTTGRTSAAQENLGNPPRSE